MGAPLQDSSEHIGLWIAVLRWQLVFIFLWQLVFPQTAAYLYFEFFLWQFVFIFLWLQKETCIVLISICVPSYIHYEFPCMTTYT